MATRTQIQTQRNPWIRHLRYPSTKTSAAALPANSATAPVSVDSSTPTSNKAVIPVFGNTLKLAFIGTDAADEIVVPTVYAWRKQMHVIIPGYDAPADDYASEFLLSATVTLGAKTGISGGVVTDSELYADTIVQVEGSEGPTSQVLEVFSPANDAVAWILIDPQGADYLEVQFDLDTAASAGVLSCWM